MFVFSLRDARFLAYWSLASGLVLSAVILHAAIRCGRIQLADIWQVGLTIYLSFIAVGLVQQVILLREGMSAWPWVLTSLLGWSLLAGCGLFNEAMVLGFVGRNMDLGDWELPFFPFFVTTICGALFGAIQMFGCSELRQHPKIWPIASAAGFLAVVLILPIQRFYPVQASLPPYLTGLAAGLAYGLITGGAILYVKFLRSQKAG